MAVCDNYGHGYPVVKYPTPWHLEMKTHENHETNAAIISHLVTFQDFAPLFIQRRLTSVQFVQLCNHHMTSPNIPPTLEGQEEKNKSAKLGNVCKYVHPPETNMEPENALKITPLQQETPLQTTNLLGSMLIFRGVKRTTHPRNWPFPRPTSIHAGWDHQSDSNPLNSVPLLL